MNQQSTLNIQQAFKDGWEGTKKHFWFLAGLVLIAGGVYLIPGIIGEMVSDTQEEGSFAFAIALLNWLLQIIIGMGSIKIAFAILAGQKPTYSLLIPEGNKVFLFIVASFIYAIIIFLGILFLIVPGIYFAIKYQFYGYRIVDTEDGIVDALRQSGELTRGVKLQLLVFMVALGLINVLGALALLIGLFVSIPVTMLATASVYRQLNNRLMPVVQSAPPAPVVIPPAA